MKINKKKLQSTKEIVHPKYKDVKLIIRPFSLFSLNQIPSMSRLENVDEYFNIFNYSVVSWKGIFDEDGKELKCIEENKKLMFDSDFSFVVDVVQTAISMRHGIITEEERKNLQVSPNGEEHVSEK